MILYYLLKELFSRPQLKRTPEPMVMNNINQVKEFCQFGESDTVLRASYIFHAYQISKTIKNCKKVADLGCGPANQLCLVAKMNPQIMFYGIDLSESMILLAKENCERLNIKNIEFIVDNISELKNVPNNYFDGAISTVALHHLPQLEDLENFFMNLKRVLTINYAIYFTDFLLPKNKSTINFLLNFNKEQPAIFAKDYEYSIKAAYSKKDFLHLKKKYLPRLNIYTTAASNFLMILKTEFNEPSKEAKEISNFEFSKLSKENKFNYRLMQILFYVGGLN